VSTGELNRTTGSRGKRSLGLTSLMLLVIILTLLARVALAGPLDYWPMFNRDLLNTGVADPALSGIAFPVEMWSYTTDNVIGSGSPVIGDIDNDGQPDVLVPTANFGSTGGVYALNADGTLKWKYQTGDYGTYATPPLADIDGDGKLETIFPSYAGKIIAVDDDGSEIWALDKGSAGTRSVIADVHDESGLEVVAGAAGKTYLLRASDGFELWNAAYTMLCDPAIADVDGDGKPEVVFSTSGQIVVALNAEDGTAAWTSALMGQDAQNNLVIIGDINADGKPDVVVGARDKKVYVFSGADGTKLWDYAVVGRCFSAAATDFNADGFDDVAITATKADGIESYVYLLDLKNQTLLWQHNIVGKKYYSTERSPSIADIDGDGTPDVVVAGSSQKLYALSGIDGSEIWNIATDDPSAGVPAIGDLNGDGAMEIVVSAGNRVQVFGNPPNLQVNVHAPKEVYVCTCFYVNATIANPTGDTIYDVWVDIYWDPASGATLLDPPGTGGFSQSIGDLASGAVADIWWQFHCEEPGPLEFHVKADGKPDPGASHVFLGEGFATVEQVPVPDPVLVVEIIQSPDYVVTPCENFAIKAKVHNVTNEPVDHVEAWINWTGDADDNSGAFPTMFYVGRISAGGSQEVGFTLHCNGPNDVEVEVDAWFPDVAPGQVMPAGVTVVQAGTTIEVELSTDTDKLCPCCPDTDTAIVTATVTNTGDDTATDVEVTIEKTGGGAVISPPLTVSLGDIPVGGSADASWTVTCNAVGNVDLKATATAENAEDVTSDTLTIYQGADLLVDILDPAPGSTFSVCQDFEVKARIMNCSGNPILVDAVLTPFVEASLVAGSEVLIEPSWVGSWTVPAQYSVSIGNVCPCCWVDVTWTLHCDGTGDGDIVVSAHGDGTAFHAEDSVYVDQEEKAHLTAGIEVFPGWASDNTLNVMPVDAVAVCDNFTVVVVVANLGEADAEDVTFIKVITGATSCAGSHPYGPVTIKGGESRKFIQECHCDGEGLVEIAVTYLAGTDENKGTAIPEDNIDMPCPNPKELHQKAITVEYLEPYEGEEFTECDFFAVKVKIHNGSDQDLADVSACLEWDESQAELAGCPCSVPPCCSPSCFYFGESEGMLYAGATHEFTWQMHCIHKGELTFLLKLISEEPRMKIEKWVTVIQKPAPPEWTPADVPLCQLWNLMSLPLIPEDPDIERVLSRTGDEIKKVAYYTGGPAGDWKFYSPSAPSDLTQMVDGKGYWMDVGADPDGNLRVWGYEHCAPPPAVPPYYEVVEGWNMIGFQSMLSKPASEYLAGLGDDLMVIYQFECEHQLYDIVLPTEHLQPGSGYLIALTGPGTIYP